MAITGFKEIVGNTGYRVDKKDREIFERTLAKSAFGIRLDNVYRHGKTDVIEVMLYDSSDNPLPQGENGELVRYIYLDDSNIGEYFTIDENNKKTNDAPKFIVNSEKIIRDAGYTTGIFKTQITLLNRRLGSEKGAFDKVWIHEISPSRTEMRVLPVKDDNDRVLPDVAARYKIFAEGGEYRDDVILGIYAFIESVDVQRVIENFLNVKGSVASGQGYINLIKSEFKVGSFDQMINRVKTKFVEIMTNYASWRDWNIDSRTYGKPLSGDPPIGLSVDEIYNTACDVMKKLIDRELPKRDLREKAELSLEEQKTFDKVKKILEEVTSGNDYQSKIPDEIKVKKPIRGCTDPESLNYNPDAEEDDGTCRYNVPCTDCGTPPPPPDEDIRGCTDPKALNYNPLATKNDGTCKYPTAEIYGCTEPGSPNYNPLATIDDGSCLYRDVVIAEETITETYYCWCDSGFIKYTAPIPGVPGGMLQVTPTVGLNQTVTITYIKGTKLTKSCQFELTPKQKEVNLTTCNNPDALNYGEVGECFYPPRDESRTTFLPGGGTTTIGVGGPTQAGGGGTAGGAGSLLNNTGTGGGLTGNIGIPIVTPDADPTVTTYTGKPLPNTRGVGTGALVDRPAPVGGNK